MASKALLQLAVAVAVLGLVDGYSALPLIANRRVQSDRSSQNLRRICMATLPPDDSSSQDFSRFGKNVDENMSVLNARIQKLKEREANPILKLQDTVADSVEPLKRETSKVAQKIPDPRDMIPSTLPKWVLPLSAIVGLSVLTTILQTQQTFDSAGLATGSL